MRTIEQISRDIQIELEEYKTYGNAYNTDILGSFYDELREFLDKTRDKWDDINYSQLIDCPDHLTHKATLYLYGHKGNGTWACPEGNVGICTHYDTKIEDSEEYEGAPDKIYICALCLVAVEGDPVADEAEAQSETYSR